MAGKHLCRPRHIPVADDPRNALSHRKWNRVTSPVRDFRLVSAGRGPGWTLENNLQPELRIERFSGPDPRSTVVVSNRV
jgi:hypothetical protein